MLTIPESRRNNIVVQETETEVLIYDLNNNKALCLNETSAMVYQLSDGTRTVTEISDQMSAKLKTLVSEDLVWLALQELDRENLLENQPQLKNKFAGMPRREAVKRVGLASLVAFPIITSIVAPPAVAAQSLAICPMSGVCFPAGTPICGGANCAGDYPVTVYTGGTNCGTLLGSNTLMCTPLSGTFTVDIRIN
jgi:hypothetical protein